MKNIQHYAIQVGLILVVVVAYDYAKTQYNKSKTVVPATTTAPKTT